MRESKTRGQFLWRSALRAIQRNRPHVLLPDIDLKAVVNLFTLWESLLDLIFPPAQECPLCGGVSSDGVICGSCEVLLRGYRHEGACEVCGRLPDKAGKHSAGGGFLCGECSRSKRAFDRALATGPYEGVLREAVHRLKYKGERHLAAPLAGLMVERMTEFGTLSQGLDYLIPVPLSTNKLHQRGFNQAQLLAKEISSKTAIPLRDNIIVKTVDTPSQTGLPKAVREVNLYGAFKVIDPQSLSHRKVMVVDDVFTTGSTVSAVARAVKQAGAQRAYVITATTARISSSRFEVRKSVPASANI